MRKTLEITEGQSISFEFNFGALEIYKAQFGKDLFSDIGKLEKMQKSKSIGLENLSELLILMLNICWTFAKNADNSIPEPFEWEKQFEILPVKSILAEILPLWTKSLAGTVSLKN